MSSLDSFFTLILQEEIAKFELSNLKKVLDECSSTLENFLVKFVHISILISLCYIWYFDEEYMEN